jgi:hypothetical protein
LTFGKVFFLPPTLGARAINQVVAAIPKIEAVKCSASRFSPKPSSPKAKEGLIVAVAYQESTRTQGVTLNANETKTKSTLSRSTHSRPVLHFPCIRRETTSGNEEGRCLFQKPPEQEDTRIFPLSLMELKFELDTRLTVSCVVAVALAYGLVNVSIALDSVLLAFGNAVILLLILFVLFGWKELLGEFGKKQSAVAAR